MLASILLVMFAALADPRVRVVEADVFDATTTVAELQVVEVLWGEALDASVIAVENVHRSHVQGGPVSSEGRFRAGQRLILKIIEVDEELLAGLAWSPAPWTPFLTDGGPYILTGGWAIDSEPERYYHAGAEKGAWVPEHLLVGRCPRDAEDVRAALRQGVTPRRIGPDELADRLRQLRRDRRALRSLQPRQRERVPSRRRLERFIEERVCPSVGCNLPFAM